MSSSNLLTKPIELPNNGTLNSKAMVNKNKEICEAKWKDKRVDVIITDEIIGTKFQDSNFYKQTIFADEIFCRFLYDYHTKFGNKQENKQENKTLKVFLSEKKEELKDAFIIWFCEYIIVLKTLINTNTNNNTNNNKGKFGDYYYRILEISNKLDDAVFVDKQINNEFVLNEIPLPANFL